MRKGNINWGIMYIMLVFGAAVQSGGCGAYDVRSCWSASYFENHPMTVQQLTEEYGKPSNIVNQESGIQDYVYLNFSKDPMLESTRHFIVKDGKVLKSYLKD